MPATPATPAPERRRGFSAAEQFRLMIPVLVVWSAGFSVLALVSTRDNVGEVLLDAAWYNGGAWYTGLVAQLGVLAWTVAAVSAAWSAWIAAKSDRPDAARFLYRGAAVGTVLLFDDLVSFHNVMLDTIGLPKLLGEAIVLTPLAMWLAVHRRDIARTRAQLLAAALVANAVSFLVDLFAHPKAGDFAVFYEDGPKFLGILAWATYFVVTAGDIARSALSRGRAAVVMDAGAAAGLDPPGTADAEGLPDPEGLPDAATGPPHSPASLEAAGRI